MSSIVSVNNKLLVTRPWIKRFTTSRFMRAVKNNPLSVFAIIVVLIFFILALFPSWFTGIDPEKINLRDRLLAPSSSHIMGTDSVGMDIYSRVIYGTRTTLKVVLVVLAIAVSFGYVVGATAGYLGGSIDIWLMRLSDIFLAFPPLILAIALNTILGQGLIQTMIAVGCSWWPSYSRIIRGQILSVKNEEYVTAAECIGASKSRILFKHILLNCFDPVIVTITLDVGYIALTTAGLSFLGLGAQPPLPEWGRMVSEGRDFLLDQWWISTFPGLALFLVVVSFNLFGELIRDWLDPSSIGRS